MTETVDLTTVEYETERGETLRIKPVADEVVLIVGGGSILLSPEDTVRVARDLLTAADEAASAVIEDVGGAIAAPLTLVVSNRPTF